MEWGWKPYVSAAERRARAARAMEKRRKQGHATSPIRIEGRAITTTFWGNAWCQNLERYSDYANRLPRGRSYLRNGSVLDLQITPGSIAATVSGSRLYQVSLEVAPVPKAKWKAICKDCSGAIDSLVELLQGRFSKNVMERICRQKEGLFPSPAEIQLSCSCPDWASMCKHVAAVLYGIGRGSIISRNCFFDCAAWMKWNSSRRRVSRYPWPTKAGEVLAGEDLSAMFGLDMAQTSALKRAKPTATKKAAAKKKPKARAAYQEKRTIIGIGNTGRAQSLYSIRI